MLESFSSDFCHQPLPTHYRPPHLHIQGPFVLSPGFRPATHQYADYSRLRHTPGTARLTTAYYRQQWGALQALWRQSRRWRRTVRASRGGPYTTQLPHIVGERPSPYRALVLPAAGTAGSAYRQLSNMSSRLPIAKLEEDPRSLLYIDTPDRNHGFDIDVFYSFSTSCPSNINPL